MNGKGLRTKQNWKQAVKFSQRQIFCCRWTTDLALGVLSAKPKREVPYGRGNGDHNTKTSDQPPWGCFCSLTSLRSPTYAFIIIMF